MVDDLVRQQEQIELLRRAILKHIETERRLALCLLRLYRATNTICSASGVDCDEFEAAQAEAAALLNAEHNLGLK